MKIKLLLFIAGIITLIYIITCYINPPEKKTTSEQQSVNSLSEKDDHLDFVEDANLVIDGILYSEDKPAAIIKGAIIHEGDMVQGKKILKIYENGIELEQFGKIWQQQVNEPVKIAAKQEYHISPSYTYENAPTDNIKQDNLENDYDETAESAYLDNTYKNHNRSSLNCEQNKQNVRRSYSNSIASRIPQENQFGNSNRFGNNRFYHVSYSNGDYVTGTSSPAISPSLGVLNANRYNPNSLANPYGAGSPYKSDGLMNPYSQYGSPYSNKSWQNPYATDAPKLYDSHGNYRGRLSTNPYAPDSTSNSYGRYGSKYSPDSINNPYGAGNPYSFQPIYVVPSR